MGKCRTVSKDRFASGPLRGAVASGLAAGLAAASLGGVGIVPANASCAAAFGINIGTGCESEFFTFSVGLGQFATAESSGFGTGAVSIGERSGATASGFFTAAGSCDCLAGGAEPTANSAGIATLSWAGGQESTSSTDGIANFAAAIGDRVYAESGLSPTDFLNAAINIGQADDAFDSGGLATSQVRAENGGLNLAVNVLGSADSGGITGPEPLDVSARGFFNSAINFVGNRNIVSVDGNFNNATMVGNVFQFPNGSDNVVTAGTSESPASLSAAFNYQGIFTDESCIASCGNIVNADSGPLAVALAFNVVQRTVSAGPGFDIKIAFPFNDTGLPPTNVLAAGGAQASLTGSDTDVRAAGGSQRRLVRPSLNAAFKDPKATSPDGSVRNAVSDRITRSTQRFNDNVKKSNDNVKRVTGGLGGGAKAAAADTGERGRGGGVAGERPHRHPTGASSGSSAK